MKISVIMPVCLTPYQAVSEGVTIKSATNPELKFIRAVNSFVFQSHPDKELIIVHDGCTISQKILQLQFSKQLESGLIKSIMLQKQPLYSGKLRNIGIREALGDVIAYLDADDAFLDTHLENISVQFNTILYDWVYWDDCLAKDIKNGFFIPREAELSKGKIGTSNIAHKNTGHVFWGNGYGHDFQIIVRYLINRHYKKIENCGYVVCHWHALEIDL